MAELAVGSSFVRKWKSYTREEKLKIVNCYYDNRNNLYQTCKTFSQNTKTVQHWLQAEEKIQLTPNLLWLLPFLLDALLCWMSDITKAAKAPPTFFHTYLLSDYFLLSAHLLLSAYVLAVSCYKCCATQPGPTVWQEIFTGQIFQCMPIYYNFTHKNLPARFWATWEGCCVSQMCQWLP